MPAIGVSLFECSFAIHVPSPEIGFQILALLPRNALVISADQAEKWFSIQRYAPFQKNEARTDEENPANPYLVSDAPGFSLTCRSLAMARDVLKTRIELYLAEQCRDYAFVHAGVVRFGSATVVIPGVSCSGKTSLVAQLVRAGGSYLSDEYALLDREGRVHPFSRSLAVRAAGGKTHLKPESLGRMDSERQQVGVVLLTRYISGATWNPKRISSARAAIEVFQNTLPAIERPRWTLDAIRAAVKSAQCLRGSRGDATQVVDWLRKAFGASVAA